MKLTLNPAQIANEIYQDQYSGFSYSGAQALARYLDQLDEDLGIDTELDTVAIRGDFAEYGSALKAAEEFGYRPNDDDDDEEREDGALVWLRERTPVIGFDGGFIVENF